MKFETIRRQMQGVPFIHPVNARRLYDWVVERAPERILELGVAHGTATCYMAAALDELGAGSITAVDLLASQHHYVPSPEQQLARAGLSHYVRVVRYETGYSWFLHDEIKRQTLNDVCEPSYDFCVIDGSKNWTIDGGAFFLVDKLLRPGGVLVFDDYSWTYALANRRRDTTDGVSHRKLSSDELHTPAVREIFELLVKQHPNYAEFELYPIEDWAMARKIQADQKRYQVHYDAGPVGIKDMLRDVVMRLIRTAAFRPR
jgi:predicted O-methyltransferase YrrM